MENNESSSKGLVNELLEGRDLTKKLQRTISNEPHSSSYEASAHMAKNILAKFERSLQILQSDPMNPFQLLHQRSSTPATVDSPNSFTGSPKSQDSEADFRDYSADHHHKGDSKKRKVSQYRIVQRVQGCTSSGLEGPIEDGYNWRKYGQKDILAANFPRSYYRCTHRALQGCSATKQVQRSDEDPSFFEVTYRGKHTCSQPSSSSSSLPLPKPEPVETQAYPPHHPTHPKQQSTNNIIWDFKRVDTNNNGEDIKPNNINHTNNPSSFSFSCSPNLLIDAAHRQNPTTIMPNNSDNFVRHDDFPATTDVTLYQPPSNVIISTSFNNDLQQGTNSPSMAPSSELLYDYQGEFGNDYFNDNSQLFE